MKKYYTLAVLFLLAHVAFFSQANVLGKFTNDVTYEKDVKPLFQKYCISCHAGSLTYKGAELTKNVIFNRVVLKKDMPPAYVSEKPNDAERDLIKRWIEQGAKP